MNVVKKEKTNKNTSTTDKKRKNTKILFLVCLAFFIILVLDTIQKMPSKYTGIEEYYEIEGIQIPTLYKYTGHANAYMAKEINDLVEGDIRGSFISIYYNEEVPEEKVNTYIEELKKIGYEKISYEGADMYVKNSEDNTKFAYIFINEIQVKYGVCVSGKYEDVLNVKENLEENKPNLEDNLNIVK